MQFKQVAPVGERVFVRIDVPEQKSAGGILLPTLAVKKATQGIVASPGSAQSVKVRLRARADPWLVAGSDRTLCIVQEGERVVYSKYAGTEITLDKQDHVILKVRCCRLQLGQARPAPADVCDQQEDDIIGLLPSDDITQLKPLGDRLLISVRHCCASWLLQGPPAGD